MEAEEKSSQESNHAEENYPKKGKILTLLFPSETQSLEGKENKKDKNRPPTKVVIRRLPPKLTKEAFLEEFSPLPAHDYFHFVRGDLNLGPYAYSRAYINFLNQDEIFSFKEKFDDYYLQDEKGKGYHVVVEFSPFQKIPKRNIIKKKLSKAGTLESDPKYIEFLQKLEEAKNFINNPSEYFHETESSALKTKVIMTPLLEYLKRKKQKKIDLKKVEREKKRKEDEKRKAERERRKDEKKNLEKHKGVEEKSRKVEEKLREKKSDLKIKDDKKDMKGSKNLESEATSEEIFHSVIPNDPAILEVVVRHSTPDKETKSGTRPLKNNDSETVLGRPEKKYSEFRSRLAEEKQRKTFYKKNSDDSKNIKSSQGNRKGVPDEKGDNCSIGSDLKETDKKTELDSEVKRFEYKAEIKETKSKFRYSEQRNRDREYRQKTSDFKSFKDNLNGFKEANDGLVEDVQKNNEEKKDTDSTTEIVNEKKNQPSQMPLTTRRKSLEMERGVRDSERKRSKSFHDVSRKTFYDFDPKAKLEINRTRDVSTPENEFTQADDNSKESTESEKMDEESKKDRRTERRIRNKRTHPCDCHPSCAYTKDRPSIEIYRPGMGKFSKQRLEQRKDDTNSIILTNTSCSGKFSSLNSKQSNKKPENKNALKSEEVSHKGNGGNGKTQNEVRTMTFTRSSSREN